MKYNIHILSTLILIFVISGSVFAGTKYWVGGSGNWSDVQHWSDVSGGNGGAALPSFSDDVVVNTASFSTDGSIVVSGTVVMKSFAMITLGSVVKLQSDSSGFLVIARGFQIAEQHQNNFLGAAYLLNAHNSQTPVRYNSGEFQVLKHNGKEQIADQSLAITSIAATPTDQTCAGDCDGSISVNVVGGGPFLYEWFLGAVPHSNGVGLNTINGLCTGQYLVIVTDQSDGDIQGVNNINVGPTFGVSLSTQPVTCPGGSDGSLSSFVIGGTAPLQYSWNSGQASSNISGVPAGSYTLTVTDFNGCTTSNTRTVIEPPPIVVTPTPDEVPVCGAVACTEDVVFTASGGNGAPFTFNPGNSATDMCPGTTFNTTVTDRLGCPMPATHTASNPPMMTVTVTEDVPVTCLGVSDGEATASAGGGTGPYTYVWLNVAGNPTTPTVTGLAQGSYTVEATDVGTGCVQTGTVVITSPTPQVVTASASITSVITCLTASNGAATASGAGGNPAYLFDWYDAPGNPTTPIVNGLPVGVYNVEVRDQDGCVDTATINVTPPAVSPVTAGVTLINDVTCLTATNGSANASGAGGTGPYDFLWYDLVGNPTSSTVLNLPLGTYNVEVTDQDNCKDTATVDVQVTVTNPVVANVTVNDVICLGLPTGDATASGSGGTGPYGFLWYDLAGNPTTPMIASLDVGTYNVEVTDVDGCKDTATAIIQAPNPPVITTTLHPIVQPTCGIQCDGGGTASAAGGVAPYSYDWFDAPGTPTGPSIASLCPGSYQVAVEDVNGCKDTVSLDLNLAPLTVSLDAKTDVLCAGQCTGTIDVSAGGGTPAYQFSWYDMPGAPTGTSVTGVCDGTYNVAAVDALGCEDTLTVTVTEPLLPVTINVDRLVNNTCAGTCIGEIDVSVAGGTAPYVSLWTDSNGLALVNPTATSITGLCNGNYTYQTTDDNGCSVTNPIGISAPNLSVSFSSSPLCPDDLVTNVQAIASGTAPFNYTWLDPVTGAATNPVQIGLTPGTYNLQVEDGAGCIAVFPFSFSIPLPITSNAVVTDALCQGVCSGTVDVTIGGGTAPYGISWFDMTGTPTTEDLTNVCAGTFNMAIQDNNGCRDTLKTVTVAPQVVLNTATSSDQTTCNGICDGKAWATASNGAIPYAYDWYTDPAGSTTDTAFNLCVGSYQLAVSDGNGCTDTVAVAVTAIPSVTVSIINQINNICSQDCNGQAEASIAGGQAPYIISWTNITGNPATPVVSNLCNGTYDVQVTDDNGCQDQGQAVIVSAAATASLNPTNPTCGGYSDGSITANLSGGATPLALKWLISPTFPTSNSITGLPQGTYELEVSDAAGCIDTFPATLTDPFPAIGLVASQQSVSCFGVCDGKTWATPTGGAAPFQYSWYNDPGTSIIDTAFNLCLGTYFVATLDNNGCRDTASVTVTNPFSINVTTAVKPPCFGVCDGTINASVSGTGTPFTFVWDDPAVTLDSTVANLCAGTYKVLVTSNSGCIDSATATISENPQIFATIDTTKSLCTNTTNGGATILASGGTLPFTYLWTNNTVYSSTLPNPTDLGVGKYYITATDAVGCTISDSVVISEQFFIDAFAGNDFVRCVGDSMLLVASGGQSYLWSTGETTDSIVVGPVVSTTYTVQTTNGPCTDEDEVVMTINDLPFADATSAQNAVLEGMSTQLTGTGAGTGTYDWTPPTTLSDPTVEQPVATPLVSTRYYLSVTDENGCTDTSSVLVKVIESILYPDGVSPNGDGINDDWPIVYIENFPDAVVEIYNRWGQQLFYSVGYKKRWDGMYEGKPLPVGTYYFVIDLGTDLPKYTGPITIFR